MDRKRRTNARPDEAILEITVQVIIPYANKGDLTEEELEYLDDEPMDDLLDRIDEQMSGAMTGWPHGCYAKVTRSDV